MASAGMRRRRALRLRTGARAASLMPARRCETSKTLYNEAMRACLALLATVTLLMACSGTSEETSSTSSSGTGAGTSSTSGGGGQGATGTGGAVEGWGVVAVQNMVINSTDNHLISAVLFDSPLASQCTHEEHGSCTVSTCSEITVGLPPQVGAGDISMSNGQQTVTLLWDGDGYGNTIEDGHF